MKQLSLLTAVLLYISAAYPAIDSWVQRCVDGKDFTIYIDAAINHVIQSSKTNVHSGLHWQHLTAQDQTIAVKKNLQVGQFTFKFNQYLVTTDSKTGLEIHHLALTSLDDNHDCIIIDRSTNTAWIKAFFGSKLSTPLSVREFIIQLLSSGDIKNVIADDQELIMTLHYQEQSYTAIIRYKEHTRNQDQIRAKLVTLFPMTTGLGTIDRGNVPKFIIEQLATLPPARSLSTSFNSEKRIPTSSSVTSSCTTPEKSVQDLFMRAAGKRDEQGKSTVKSETLLELLQQDPELANTIDVQGNTALHYVAETADTEGALNTAWIFMSDDILNHQNAVNETPLTVAIKNKHYELAQRILFAGGTSQAEQAAKYAVQTQDLASLSILIDHIDIYAPIKQFTMLGYAVSINCKPLIELLLQHGADPRALRYKNDITNTGLEFCETIEPQEFINKFSHAKKDKEELVALLTDELPTTPTEKLERWWQYLHEGKYLSAAKLYEKSWYNQQSPGTGKPIVEFACKRGQLSLVRQLLADGADALVWTTQGQSLCDYVSTLARTEPSTKKLAIEQAITQAVTQQVVIVDACIEKIQSQELPDITKFTSSQLQYISPKYRCSIAQALSLAHNHSVMQTVLTQHKVALAPVLHYFLDHTTDWQHPASQQILTTLTARAKETQDKASFDALTNFCMRQTDVHQVSAIVLAVATAGANALELKLVEHFVTANPAIAVRLIAQLSDRGLKLSREKRCAGNKMTLAELIVEKQNVPLLDTLVQHDKELNLDTLRTCAINNPEISAVVQEHTERRALQTMIDQDGHTPLTLAIVRGESAEKIKEILVNSPELLNQPSSKANIHPCIYALKYAPILLAQELVEAQIPENAIEQALAVQCSSSAVVELLSEKDCSLPLDACIAQRLMQSQEVHCALAQKVAEYIELHKSLEKIPEVYFPLIQGFWEHTSQIPAATKFTRAQLARMKTDEQKLSYLMSLPPAGMIETVSEIRDTELIAQLIIRVISRASDTEIIEKLFDLLHTSQLFTLTVKNQSLITTVSPFLDKYLPRRLKQLSKEEVVDQLTHLVNKDSFISHMASIDGEFVRTICEQLQDPVFTAKIIVKRLANNTPCTILHELITQDVASIELDKDGSTLAHLLMNHEDTDILLHYCAKFPELLFKPNKKKLTPVDVAIKKNKESVLNTIVQNGHFNIHDLFDNFSPTRNLYTLSKEHKIIKAHVKALIEQEFSQAANVLQRAVELSPALIPDAAAYMEQQGIEPTIQDYVTLHNAKEFDRFDSLLTKHHQQGISRDFLFTLAKQVPLRGKKYLESSTFAQLIIEMAESQALNEQVFDMTDANPAVVDSFPFCIEDLDEETLMRDLVARVKPEAPAPVLAKFIHALEVVAENSSSPDRENVLLAIYNKCQSYAEQHRDIPETFLLELCKIATNENIRFKINQAILYIRFTTLLTNTEFIATRVQLLTGANEAERRAFWDKELLNCSNINSLLLTTTSITALAISLFGSERESLQNNIKQFIDLSSDTSEMLRKYMHISTIAEVCHYLQCHDKVARQDAPELEQRFVELCVAGLRHGLKQVEAQKVADTIVELIDICPTHGLYILNELATELELVLGHISRYQGTLKHPARHIELLVQLTQAQDLAAAKFLVTVSPTVNSCQNLLDLDPYWDSIDPEIRRKLQSIDRVADIGNLFTFAHLLECGLPSEQEQESLRDPNFGTKLIQFLRDEKNPQSANIKSLYFESLENIPKLEHLKIDCIIRGMALAPHYQGFAPMLALASGILYIYHSTLSVGLQFDVLEGSFPWNHFFLHRNTIPLLYIYLRLLDYRFNANIEKPSREIFEQLRGRKKSNQLLFRHLSSLSQEEVSQFYFAIAYDLEICGELFGALQTETGVNLRKFCIDFSHELLKEMDLHSLVTYANRPEMLEMRQTIMTTIQGNNLNKDYDHFGFQQLLSCMDPSEILKMGQKIGERERSI